jgi:molybdopterin converting factor subunit 1
MTINILAFGIVKEIVGGASVDLQFEENITVEALKAELDRNYPRLKQLTSFMIAVNKEYAQPDKLIQTGDEVAIIPPVSGG